jgi:hypothetical protein
MYLQRVSSMVSIHTLETVRIFTQYTTINTSQTGLFVSKPAGMICLTSPEGSTAIFKNYYTIDLKQ